MNMYLEIWNRQGHILLKIDSTFVKYFDLSGYMYLECSGLRNRTKVPLSSKAREDVTLIKSTSDCIPEY